MIRRGMTNVLIQWAQFKRSGRQCLKLWLTSASIHAALHAIFASYVEGTKKQCRPPTTTKEEEISLKLLPIYSFASSFFN